MDENQIDPELHEALKSIRESVRMLFEQLRLKHEAGDISGKERLERVPALAKRNFANLRSANPLTAARQAWRLIDFLEGKDEMQLSPLAREGLRVVELDKKLAGLRASSGWKAAAARLRETLGVQREVSAEASAPGAEPVQASAGLLPTGLDGGSQGPGGEPKKRRGRQSRRLWASLASGTVALLAVGGLIWDGALRRKPDPRFACLALENASPAALAQHREARRDSYPARPPRTGGGGQHTLILSDPPNGGPVLSTWTTSQYSYAEGMAANRPGGGRSDVRLRVGGHGDTYLSLVAVPISSDRLAHRAVLELTVLGDAPGSRPATMSLRAVGDSWSVAPGPANRMWWRDCPRSEPVRNRLPAPGPPGSVYAIDITDVYNMWARGLWPAYGIMLEPEQIGSWGAGRPSYANFNTFYSTRARDPQNRPRLVLTF